MISRSRRRDGWIRMFRTARNKPGDSTDLLDDAKFAVAIKKERARAERRELSFCVIRFEFVDTSLSRRQTREQALQLSVLFRKRLRITDEIGQYQESFGVLLTETAPFGAAKVANDLTQIAQDEDMPVSTDIFAFPDSDDQFRPPNQPGNNGVYQLAVDDDSFEGERNGDSHGERNGDSREQVADSHGGVATRRQPDTKTGKTIRVQKLNTSIPSPWWKRVTDIAGATAGLIVLSPILLIAAIAIRLTSRGPVLFTQWREGQDGRLFRIYKFRTMRHGADTEKWRLTAASEQDGPAFKIKNDPRLTRVGKYLRKTCADELPQLLNVLKGEMSLVGPRPLPVDESLNCSGWHRRRLDVAPGMTCIWQVDGGRDIPFDQWMRMDLEYIRCRGFLTDSRLIAKTFFVTLLHRGSV
ncbi:MAG: sugar transferase [Pirellulaceae bacterium]